MVGSFSLSVRLPFPMVSFFGYWGLFRFRPRFLRSGPSFASFRLNGGLRDSLFVLRSGWSSVFPLSCSRFVFFARSFALRSPSFPMVLVSPSFRFSSSLFPFLLSDGLRFLLDSLQGSSLFCLRSLFRLFALGSASFPFPFSLIRLALPFISFVVFGFLSASLHRDAPSGGGIGRAAWPRRIRRIGRT